MYAMHLLASPNVAVQHHPVFIRSIEQDGGDYQLLRLVRLWIRCALQARAVQLLRWRASHSSSCRMDHVSSAAASLARSTLSYNHCAHQLWPVTDDVACLRSVVAFGALFTLLTSVMVFLDYRFGGASHTSEQFSTAGVGTLVAPTTRQHWQQSC
jgi:hypothetical protein